jgi:putative NIF3 family GTP cyclohydrolase 1 type 2
MSKKEKLDRRKFLMNVSKAVGATTLFTLSQTNKAENFIPAGKAVLTVQQVIDLIMKDVPRTAITKTVDTLKAGSPTQPVTGIVTTMFATIEVIEKAIALGANFIIAHEPTFYNHLDETQWLENNEVYHYKYDLLIKNKIAVWRFHDYIHLHVPDGVRIGVVNALGWEKYYDSQNPRVLTLPPITVRDLVMHAKEKLGINTVRILGDQSQMCQRILLMPGAAGGMRQIEALNAEKPDVIICGEISEWETGEFVRDARLKGQALSLIILGHVPSEEPGMEWLVSWLRPKVPGTKITHIQATNPFTFI